MARTERGASAVEFAIVFPLLFLFLAAIIDFGRAYFYQVQLTNAAREGARAASVSTMTAAQIQARVAAAVPGIAASDLSYPTLNQCPSADGNATVAVSAPFSWIVLRPAIAAFNGGSWAGGNSLTSTAVMKCGG